MGNNSMVETSKIFEMPQFSQSGWEVTQAEVMHLNSNYLYVAENLLDPARVSFVHLTKLGISASEDVPFEFETDGDGCAIFFLLDSLSSLLNTKSTQIARIIIIYIFLV